MSDSFTNEPLLDMYIFESEQLLEQLEQLMLDSEKADGFAKETIDEIFRIMHTIKGSSAMMMLNAVSNLAHCVEDLFYFLRNGEYDGTKSSYIADLVFESIDFIKEEIVKIRSGNYIEGDSSDLISRINEFINALKSDTSVAPNHEEKIKANLNHQDTSQIEINIDVPKHTYKAILRFEEDCEMENIRAYAVVHHLQDVASEINHVPEDLSVNECSEDIKKNGFLVVFRSDLDYDRIQEILLQTIFLKDLTLTELDSQEFDSFSNTKNFTRNISD